MLSRVATTTLVRSTQHLAKVNCVGKRTFFSKNSVETGYFPSRGNYGLNILPNGYKYVIERFGRFTGVEGSGLKIMIPFVDKIAYVVDDREMVIPIDPQNATTDDNVMIVMAGNLFIRFSDAERAAYGANRPVHAATQFAQSVMRTAAGDYSLDVLFKERNSLNSTIVSSMTEGAAKWGCEVTRFEITELYPSDQAVSASMHKQSTAERERREVLINAEAYQKETEKKADAYRYKQEMEAQGNAERVKLEADAEAFRVRQIADANAYSIKQNADAQAESIQMISNVLVKEGGEQAIMKQLSEQYIAEFGKLAQKTNTLIIPQNVSDVSSIIASGMAAYKKVQR